ncbi:MAG: hypothetical protein NTX47_01320, partial [Candidatus Omnitrophica bacterium]|nr:hypothetical protein [Candidatus Omnitrophota bacterium]
MKKLLFVLVIGIVLGITASANAALITIGTSGETKIYQIYNARYGGIDYVSNSALEAQENNAAISAGLFTEASTGGTIYFVARYAGDTHSLYAYNTSDLNGSDVGFSDSDSIGTHYHIPSSINDPFGFRLRDTTADPDTNWYSQIGLNSDNR